MPAEARTKKKMRLHDNCKLGAGNYFAIIYVLYELIGRLGNLPCQPSKPLSRCSGKELCTYARRLLENKTFWRKAGDVTNYQGTNLRWWLEHSTNPCSESA